MRTDADLDVQVTCGAAIGARLAVTGRADAHAFVDTGRNLDFQGFLLLDAALAVAVGAGIRDDLAGAVAVRAGLLHAEKALTHVHRARAVTGRTGLGAGAWLGARAMAVLAFVPGRDANLRVLAMCGFFQRDLHGVRQVAASVHLRTTAATSPATGCAEDVAKDVTKGVGKAPKAFCATTACTHVRIDASVTELVVGLALLRVRQHLVGLFDLLELLFGFLGLVPLIAVRVILHGQFAVGLLDLVFGGRLGHPEHFIKIAFRHVVSRLNCKGTGVREKLSHDLCPR